MNRAAPIVFFSLLLSCGRTHLRDEDPGGSSASTCPEPASELPDAGSLELPPGAGYETFQVAFHNHCAETLWPAWGRSGGLDQTVADPALWAPMPAGDDRAVTMHFLAITEVAFWARTRCSFDEQGNGACETGDCGSFVCPDEVNQFPTDATIYDLHSGFRGGYNVSMFVKTVGCSDRVCVFDLPDCPDDARTVGACGLVGCSQVCPSSSTCCHDFPNGCFFDTGVNITFCP